MKTLMLFVICVNLAVGFLLAINPFPVSQVPEGYRDSATIQSTFNVFGLDFTNWITTGFGIGGILFAIGGFLRKDLTIASVALLLFVVSSLIDPISFVLLGFPKLVISAILMAGEGSAEATILATGIGGILSALFAFVFFMTLIEVFAQRKI